MSAPTLTDQIQGAGSVSADALNTYVQGCDNVAQLRAFTGVSGMQVFVRGTVTPNDGGQGNYYWSASSTAPDNGLSVVKPSGIPVGYPGAWLLLNAAGGSGSGSALAVYPNIATLRATTAYTLSPVLVEGYYAIGDGGGGLYYWSGSSTASDNGGTIIAPNAGGTGRWLLDLIGNTIDFVQFGADPTGSNDSTARVQACDDFCSLHNLTARLNKGTILISPVGITKGSCSWRGADRNTCVFKSTAGTYANLTGMVTGTNLNGAQISELTFDITDAVFPAGVGNPGNIFWAVSFITSTDWQFFNCRVVGIQPHTIGLAVNGGSDFVIDRNYFYMPSPTSSQYNQSCNISNSAGTVGTHQFTNNILSGSGFFSIASYGLVQGNYAENVAFGTNYGWGPDPSIVFNRICDNIGLAGRGYDINQTYISGIEYWGAYSILSGNMLLGNDGPGIFNGGVNNTITSNLCLNNGQNAGSGNPTPNNRCGLVNATGTVGRVNYGGSYSMVASNYFEDNQGTPTQLYGIIEFPDVTRNVYGDNFYTGGSGVTSTQFNGTIQSWRGPTLLKTIAATPGTITNGNSYTGVITVPYAALGDWVQVSYTQDLQGVVLSGWVSSANAVSYVFANVTGGSKTLTAGTVNIRVEKPPGFAVY